MGTFAPPQLTVGAVRKNLPYGLFSVLALETPAEPYWQAGGVRWEWLNGTVSEAIGAPTDDNMIRGLPKKFEAESGDPVWDGVAEATPFSVYGHFKASPTAWGPDRSQQRAIEHLLIAEEGQVEYQLWTGTIGNHPHLGDSPTNLGTGTPSVALSLLEKHIGDTYGSLGVIHMGRENASLLMSAQALEVRNGQLQTKLGTPCVAGTGYDSDTMFSTPALFGYRSEVFTSSRQGSPLLDTTSNDLYSIAERTYLIGYDPTGVGSVTIS